MGSSNTEKHGLVRKVQNELNGYTTKRPTVSEVGNVSLSKLACLLNWLEKLINLSRLSPNPSPEWQGMFSSLFSERTKAT